MKRRIITSIIAVLLTAATSTAAPARGGWLNHTQKDGSMITVRLVGDEFCHYYITQDGTIMEQSANGDFVKSLSTAYNTQLKRSITRAVEGNRRGASTTATPGKKRQLVILMQYPDKDFLNPDPKTYWHNALNTGNVEGKKTYGSLHQYYLDQSDGILDIDFDVYGPFITKHDREYYGKNINDLDQYADQLVIEACQAVEGIANLSDYDWDGDGEVEQVAVIYAGNGENDSQAKDRDVAIWPHQYQLSAYQPYKPYTYGNNTIDKYVVINDEFRGTTDGFGTIAHEYSHCLGLPDFYQTDGTAHGKDNFGDYDLMHSGCYNGGSWCPVNYTAHEKEFMGWIKTDELNTPTSVIGLNSMANGGKAYKIVNDTHPDEYYLLENRRKEGWDAFIPGEGLIITHYDYKQSIWWNNTINNDASHLRASIIPACGNHNNSAKYPYPYIGSDGTKVINDRLTDSSTPAASVFNGNSEDTRFMGKPVTNIQKDDNGLISFDFMKDTSAIDDIQSDSNADNLEYFDMQGRKAGSPTAGYIYIIRNKKTNKTYKSFNK